MSPSLDLSMKKQEEMHDHAKNGEDAISYDGSELQKKVKEEIRHQLSMNSSKSHLVYGNQDGKRRKNRKKEAETATSKDQLLNVDDDEEYFDFLRDETHLSKIFIEDMTHLFEELKGAGQRFFTYSQLPMHLRDNDSIWTGYRAHYNMKECLQSIFQIHNETGNIWTHLLGALFFIGCMVVCWTGSHNIVPPEGKLGDYVMMTIFLVSAVKCLLCSTIFHTFSAHGHSAIFDSVAILDYTGISILIFGSFMILINYGLYCFPTLRWTYIGVLGTLCLSGVILPWFRFFRRASFRAYRALFFVTLGFASSFCAFHTIYLNGWEKMNALAPMEFYLYEILFYLIGALIYVKRVPEVWFPGKLDHLFHSHQVWHLFVFMGAYFHYRATIVLMHSRITQDTCTNIL